MIVLLSNGPVPCAEFVCLLTPQRMAALRRHLPIDNLSPANGNTLNDILADPISRKHLFPEGIIVRDAEVFDAQESNTFMIMQRCTLMLVSGSASSTYTSLSFGYVVTYPIGRHYNIEYYGKKDDSRSRLASPPGGARYFARAASGVQPVCSRGMHGRRV